jgi:hypothetical protein
VALRRLAVLVILLAAALMLPRAAHAQRVRVELAPGLERWSGLEAKAERDLAEIEADLPGLPVVDHVEVRLVKHAEDLVGAAPAGRGAPPWAIGVAYPDLGIVTVAVRARNGDLVDVDKTLAHELAHMALVAALGEGRVPRWLNEGFAWLHSAENSWGRATTLAGAVWRGDLMPLDKLEESFPRGESEVALAYAQSYDFAAFLASRGRYQDDRDDGDREPFQRFLREIAHGKTPNAAAFTAYGRSLDQLEGEWMEQARTRYMWLPVGVGTGFLWGIGGILLVFGWMRRRRQAKLRLRQWEIEEALADSQAAADRGQLN